MNSLHTSRLKRLHELRATVNATRDVRRGNAGGPGTELRALLGTIGIHPMKENCACNEHAREMDRRGPDWCLTHLETILDWLAEEAKKRPLLGKLFHRTAARQVVLLAIRRARQKAASV